MVNNEEPEDKEKPVQAKLLTETSREPLQRQPEAQEEDKEPIQATAAASWVDGGEGGRSARERISRLAEEIAGKPESELADLHAQCLQELDALSEAYDTRTAHGQTKGVTLDLRAWRRSPG